MRTSKKPKQLKIIPLFIFITLSFIATIFYIFLKDIEIVPILLKEYIDSGNSIFIPYIPYINVFWFLSEKNQVIRLSIGQLLDLIIIYNIISYIETNLYHYIKFSIFNGNIQNFNYLELNFNKYKEKNHSLFTNPEEYLDLESETRYIFEDKSLNSTEKQCNLNKKRNIFKYQLKSLRFKINQIQNHLHDKNSKFILTKSYNNFSIFLNYSIFKDSWILCPIYYYFPLKANNFTYYNKIQQMEGKKL